MLCYGDIRLHIFQLVDVQAAQDHLFKLGTPEEVSAPKPSVASDAAFSITGDLIPYTAC